MVSQFKTVSIFVYLILFFPFQTIHSQQLALPNLIISEIRTHEIYVKDFTDPYSEHLFTQVEKNNVLTCRSILNNMIGESLLVDNVTLSIITKIEFINNKSHLTRELRHGKVFLFQPTNFIT